MKKIEEYVRSIPDFPEPGIIFRDVTSVIQDADGLQLAIDSMQDCLNHSFWYVKQESSHVRPFPELTIWNMEVQRSRCIRILSSQDRRL